MFILLLIVTLFQVLDIHCSLERSRTKSLCTRQKHQRPLPVGSRYPFQVHCDVAARCTGSNKSIRRGKRTALSQGGCAERRFQGKKINWADVIRSIPTIRLCAAFIRDVRTNRSGPLSSITGIHTCAGSFQRPTDYFFSINNGHPHLSKFHLVHVRIRERSR